MIFKNDSSDDMNPSTIIKLTGIEVQDNKTVRLVGNQPDSAANFILAVTGLEVVAVGKWGQCTPMGNVFQAKYDTADGTPANEENWGCDNGTSLLKKNFGGGQHAVIGSDSTSELAVVMHTGIVQRWGKADAAVVSGATGTYSVYVGTGATSSWTDSGDNVTARNLFEADATTAQYHLLTYAGSEWGALPIECA